MTKYTNIEIGALADAFKKSLSTIERWIASDDDRLTSDKAKKTLAALKSPKTSK